jgi:hypothetical protein
MLGILQSYWLMPNREKSGFMTGREPAQRAMRREAVAPVPWVRSVESAGGALGERTALSSGTATALAVIA